MSRKLRWSQAAVNAAHFISHAAGNTAEFEQTGFFLPRRVLQTQVGLKGVKTHIINTSKEAERVCVSTGSSCGCLFTHLCILITNVRLVRMLFSEGFKIRTLIDLCATQSLLSSVGA